VDVRVCVCVPALERCQFAATGDPAIDGIGGVSGEWCTSFYESVGKRHRI
jgi:hypothetical protein